MNCSGISWNRICTELPKQVRLIRARDIGLFGLRQLAERITDLESQHAKIQVMLQYCEEHFPKLMPCLAGKFEDEDEQPAGSPDAAETQEHSAGSPDSAETQERPDPYQHMRERRQIIAVLLNSLAKLCVMELIYPPIFFAELLKHMVSMDLTPKYGSGLFLDSPDAMVCANLGRKYSTSCQKPARVPCPHCKLVSYCTEACRRAHWPIHQHDCARAMRKPATRQEELFEYYKSWLRGTETRHPTPLTVWDRAPAFGLLGDVRDAEAAGSSSSRLPNPLRLLFLDCYDLNNVIETLHQLDSKFSGEVTLFVNSPNLQALARHLILWSMLLDMAEKRLDVSAVDAVIAIWYSATLSPSQYLLLMDTVLQILNTTTSLLPSQHPLREAPKFRVDSDLSSIQQDMNQLTSTFELIELDGILKQIMCSGSSIYLRTVGLELWKYLALMGIGCWDPKQANRNNTLSKYDRLHGLDEFLLEAHFDALESFRDYGLALPVSSLCCTAHQIPNPTLISAIDNPRAGWTVKCTRFDPLSGWPINEVVKSTRGAPCYVPDNDIFGSQYFYVRTRILSAVDKLRNCRIALEFTCHDKPATQLIDIWCNGPGVRSMYRIHADFHLRFDSPTPSDDLQSFVCNRGAYLANHTEEYRLVMLYQVIELHPIPGAPPYRSYDDMDLTPEQAQFAMGNFDKFIAKCGKRGVLAKKLRLYAKAIRDERVPDMLTPLFMQHKLKPYLAKLYQTIDIATSGPTPEKPGAPESKYKVLVTRAPTNLVVPCKPSLVYTGEEAASSSKQGKKMRAPAAGSKMNSMTTAEECYMQIFFTLLNHFEVFLEWQQKPVLNPVYRGP